MGLKGKLSGGKWEITDRIEQRTRLHVAEKGFRINGQKMEHCFYACG